MYIYDLWGRFEDGEHLTERENELLGAAYMPTNTRREPETPLFKKTRRLRRIGLVIAGLVILYWIAKEVCSSVRSSPTSEATSANPLKTERDYRSTLESLEYQAQSAIDHAVQLGIGGNQALRSKYLNDAKIFYNSALEMSKTSTFGTSAKVNQLEKNLDSLKEWEK